MSKMFLAFVAPALLLSTTAFADQNLTFDSDVLQEISLQNRGPNDPYFTVTNNPTFTFEVSLDLLNPLTGNLTNQQVIPAFWAVSGDGYFEVSNNTVGSNTGTFLLTTNSAGTITDWDFKIDSCCQPSANGSTVDYTSSSFLGQSTYHLEASGAFVPTIHAVAVGGSGSWKGDGVLVAPEFDGALGGSGLLFLGAGLAVLNGRRRAGARIAAE